MESGNRVKTSRTRERRLPISRAAGNHIGQHDAVLARQPETSRENRGDGLRANPDIASPHPSQPPDLFVDSVDDVARRAEAQTLGGASLRQNQCVDPDDSAAQIDRRPTAEAGLIAASACTHIGPESRCRATALTTPSDTELSSPSGLPIDRTS
jgi:hypothetical protein